MNGDRKQLTAQSSFPAGEKNIYLVTHTSGEQKGYSNGVSSGVDGNYATTLTSRNNISIGARSNNADGTSHSIFYQGHISEIIVFNKVLSENERVMLIRSQKGRCDIT